MDVTMPCTQTLSTFLCYCRNFNKQFSNLTLFRDFITLQRRSMNLRRKLKPRVRKKNQVNQVLTLISQERNYSQTEFLVSWNAVCFLLLNLRPILPSQGIVVANSGIQIMQGLLNAFYLEINTFPNCILVTHTASYKENCYLLII